MAKDAKKDAAGGCKESLDVPCAPGQESRLLEAAGVPNKELHCRPHEEAKAVSQFQQQVSLYEHSVMFCHGAMSKRLYHTKEGVLKAMREANVCPSRFGCAGKAFCSHFRRIFNDIET